MRQHLEKIPTELAKLFEMILTRDGDNPKLLQICLQWILFATRPMKPQELYFAVQFGLKEAPCSGQWDQETVDLDEMKAFVRHSSKGLAEVTRSKTSEVQFIHESVRDFLLGNYGAVQWSGAILSGNFEGQSHEVLRDCCLAQLETDVDLTLLATSEFPFLEYSVLNILQHANSAQQHGMEQRAFLDIFPLRRWTTLNDLLEKYAIRRYRESASLRYILAEKNLANLITIHPRKESCFDVVPKARYGPPIFAALATGSTEAVRALLEAEVQAQPVESQCRLREHCKLVFENQKQLGNLGGSSFKFARGKGVLGHLAEHGHEAIVKLLLATGNIDVDVKGNYGRMPLSYAAGNGHEAVVKLLLATGNVDVNVKDNDGWTPLSYAAGNGHEAVVKLLLATGNIDVDVKDKNWGRTPLSWAAGNGNEAVVKLLLATGNVDVDAKDYYGQTLLSRTAENGHEAVVKLLLATGKVDVDTKDKEGRTPLSWAAENSHEAVVKLLLATGNVDIDVKDNYGRTPLSRATGNGHEAVAKLLGSVK